jgi:hypothetical protein
MNRHFERFAEVSKTLEYSAYKPLVEIQAAFYVEGGSLFEQKATEAFQTCWKSISPCLYRRRAC